VLRQIEASLITPGVGAACGEDVLSRARDIVEEVKRGGVDALRRIASGFGEIDAGEPLLIERDGLQQALDAISPSTRGVLERTADRIRVFAEAQRRSLSDLDTAVPGGRVGHTVVPMEVAGCYAPGGRYPLPSSVLMTAIPARVAGVATVVAATPSRDPVMRAAAAIAGVDVLLCVGGAQAIAALAYGVGVPACDVIVGPGNKWVTAAKHCVSSVCAIDMLAGPSELLILADSSASPAVIASDLLAQAEHDPDALPCLVTTAPGMPAMVNAELERQLSTLPTADIARAALRNGWCCVVGTMEEAVCVSDMLAPEHLEIMTENPASVAAGIKHAGGVFIGTRSAEVLGDYGIGPNHTLPTGRTARARGGLSVFDFLRVRTWIEMENTSGSAALEDAVSLARIEGLEAHARSAELRR
jgi:histidinol dehydrogenase